MRSNIKIVVGLFTVLVFIQQLLYAQKDSSANLYNKKFDSLVYKSWNKFGEITEIDINERSISNSQQSSIQSDHAQVLSNLSSATYQLNSIQHQVKSLTLLNNLWSSYDLNEENVSYFHTTKPLTTVMYSNANKDGQYAKILHTRNIDSNFNITFQLNKFASFGYFRFQRTNSSHVRLSSYYKHHKYSNQWCIYYNKNEQDENGGISNQEYLNVINFYDRRTIPVNVEGKIGENNRSSIYRQNKNYGIQYQHSYLLNKLKKDSASNNLQFALTHRVHYKFDSYTYNDVLPDSTDYIAFVSKTFSLKDSVYARPINEILDNYFAIQSQTGKGNNKLNYTLGVGNEMMFLNVLKYNTYFNNYFSGELSTGVKLAGMQTALQVFYKQYFSGYTIGNYNLLGKLQTSIGQHTAGVQLELNKTNTPILYSQYKTNQFNFSNDLKGVFSNSLKAFYKNNMIDANLFLAQMFNYTYIDTNFKVQQLDALNVIGSQGKFTLHYKKIYLRSNNLLQLNLQSASPLSLPIYSGIHSLSYDNYIFKKAMRASMGLEMAWNSSFYAPRYLYQIGQFALQNTWKQNNLPRTALFFNFNVKRLRGFVMLDEIQQSLVLQDWWITKASQHRVFFENQPGPNMLLRLGFDWAFVN